MAQQKRYDHNKPPKKAHAPTHGSMEEWLNCLRD